VIPEPLEYLPALHEIQLPSPSPVEYFPAGHTLQLESPLSAYVPEPQFSHTFVSNPVPVENFPAEQEIHWLIPVPLEYDPPGHVEHALEPVLAKVPSPQTEHVLMATPL
jgi:hypothetical protein